MQDLLPILQSHGLIRSAEAVKLTPLSGGVSCDIVLVEEGDRRFVLKRALAKLRVKDDWFADVNRNRHEQDYLDYAGAILPTNFPKILHRDPEHGFFTMEYLGGEFRNWKKMLLAGEHELMHAEEAGRILGTIHRQSWDDPVARERFATDKNFYDLRIEPYLMTTGDRCPGLRPLIESEAKRLAVTKLCLVHGDFSPKNILVSRSRMVILDCEVAWFGDPAFDAAFLLNHLMLKALLFLNYPAQLRAMVTEFWRSYRQTLAPLQINDLDNRTARLLLMLMLARVDGKSPVEYLSEDHGNLIRAFVNAYVWEAKSVEQIADVWLRHLNFSARSVR